MNKKGFTLVELLAVIVILAVIMLVAVTAIGPIINNSKKSAFESSVRMAQQAAENYYLINARDAKNGSRVSIDTLISEGYFDNKGKNYSGEVILNIEPTTGKKSYKITMRDEAYSVTEIDPSSSGWEAVSIEDDSETEKLSPWTETCNGHIGEHLYVNEEYIGICGDVNGDNSVDEGDSNDISNYLSGALISVNILLGDVNGNGKLDTLDNRGIKTYFKNKTIE